jgi:hypothetical protein
MTGHPTRVVQSTEDDSEGHEYEVAVSFTRRYEEKTRNVEGRDEAVNRVKVMHDVTLENIERVFVEGVSAPYEVTLAAEERRTVDVEAEHAEQAATFAREELRDEADTLRGFDATIEEVTLVDE